MIANMFITFLNMTISATIGGMLLILWRRITQKYIPYKYYYILWGVLFLRFTMPVSFTSVFSLLGFAQAAGQPSSGGGYIVTMEYIDTGKITTLAESYGSNLLNIISAVWLIVAAGLILLWFYLYLKTKKKLEYAVLFRHPAVDRVKEKVKTGAKFHVYSSPEILSPVVLGFVNPRIILPKKLDVTEQELECILAHEIIHLKRKDQFIKAFTYFIAAMHWYNPLVWLCFYLFNEDIELSCDRELLKIFGRDYKSHYARALVNYAAEKNRFKTAYLAFARGRVTDRVSKILMHSELSLFRAALFYTVTVFIGLSVTANPVLRESYMYVPESKVVAMSTRNGVKSFAEGIAQDISHGNTENLLHKSTADREYFAPLYRELKAGKVGATVDRIFYTSQDSAVVYITLDGESGLFPQGTRRAVLEVESSGIMNGFYAESLQSYTRYEAIHTVDNENEAVMLRHKMIKYGLDSGENTPQNSRKITMFCMDIAYERRKNKNTVLAARAVESVAEEFFLITDYSNMRGTEFYSEKENRYSFDTDLGTQYEYSIISLETDGGGRQVIAEFYKDPLQLQTEKIIKYTFRKVK